MLLPLQRLRKERTIISLFIFATAQHRPKETASERPQQDAPARSERLLLDTTTCPLHNAKQQNRKKDLAPAFRRLHRPERMFCRSFASAVMPACGGLLSIAKNAREVGLGSRKLTYHNYESSARCVYNECLQYAKREVFRYIAKAKSRIVQVSPSCQNLSGYGCSAASSYIRAAVWQDLAQRHPSGEVELTAACRWNAGSSLHPAAGPYVKAAVFGQRRAVASATGPPLSLGCSRP